MARPGAGHGDRDSKVLSVANHRANPVSVPVIRVSEPEPVTAKSECHNRRTPPRRRKENDVLIHWWRHVMATSKATNLWQSGRAWTIQSLSPSPSLQCQAKPNFILYA